jgi:hypothetical protein
MPGAIHSRKYISKVLVLAGYKEFPAAFQKHDIAKCYSRKPIVDSKQPCRTIWFEVSISTKLVLPRHEIAYIHKRWFIPYYLDLVDMKLW